METKNLEKYEEQQERNDNYSKLLMEFQTFKDISTMCPNIIIFRNKIGTTYPSSLLISHDIVSSGISAMKLKYIEELKKLNKGTIYE